MEPATVLRPDPLLWYDARLWVPPPYRTVAVLVRGMQMAQTGYLQTAGGWKVVGKVEDVAWWSACLPVPYPVPAAEERRSAYELTGMSRLTARPT